MGRTCDDEASRSLLQPLLIDLTRLDGEADFSLMPNLFPPHLRPHIVAFGRFVRRADQVAASASLTRQDKIARLDMLEASLDTPSPMWSDEAQQIAEGLRRSLEQTGASAEHARRIVRAFRGDVVGVRKRTWEDLLSYCRSAAAPVGHYLLELLGEDEATCAGPADALCAALCILKRLRDFRDPIPRIDRLCIPQQFMDDALISVHHLQAASAKGQTRAVLDRVLDGVDHLLETARPLPPLIRSPGLRMHTAIVMCRGNRLAGRFREKDPLQSRVSLTRWERVRCRWSVVLSELLKWR